MVRIRVIVCVRQPSHHFLQTFRPLRMFKDCVPRWFTLSAIIVFILSAMADQRKRWPYWLHTKFCSMIELLHQLKKVVFDTEAFRHFIMSQQGKRKTTFSGHLCITKNWKFSCVLYAHSQFLCSRVANLAFLNTFGFFGNKKARKMWLFLAYFQSHRLGSGKTLSELHIHYKYLVTRVYYHAGCAEYCQNFTVTLKWSMLLIKNKCTTV